MKKSMPNLMYKFRLYPSKRQIAVLEEKLEICRQTYNWLLLHCRETYKETKKLPRQFDLNNILTGFKIQREEIRHVHSQALQNISKRIKDAYTGFYARRRVGLKAGLPRFKKYGTYKSITYPQFGYKIEGNRLKLSKVGNVRLRQHRDIQGQIKTLTVKCNASGKWYACFSCIIEEEIREKPFNDVGIDVGLKTFAVLSDKTVIENPRLYRKSEKSLARLQRQLSRKKKGSNNRNKATVKVARLHEYIQNSRRDFLHKASRMIADNYETVYVEDLQITNMVRNRHLSKSISDAGWGDFTRMIAYKELRSGGRIVYVNPKNTTQNCSQCGEQVKKTLSDRIHECPHCGLEMDRDLNAALNILERGREIGQELSEYTPVGEEITIQPKMAEQIPSMNQEAHPFRDG